MTDISQKILQRYQIRKSKKQKNAFIELIKDVMPAVQVQQSPIVKSRNLILGDISSAKAVLTAHYDTCARMPIPNFITPMNPLLSLGYSLLILIPVFTLILMMNFLLSLLDTDFWLHYFLSLAAYFTFFFLLLAGPANRHTANDNTSGVITLLEIYQSMDEDERKKVVFVFFDNEELGLLGSSYFNSKFKKKMKDKLLINFDCVSDGDYFLIAASKKARKAHEEAITAAFTDQEEKKVLHRKLEKVHYPSDQAGFPVSIAVAALKHKKRLGYYMDKIHTKQDTVFQEENIRYLAENTRQLIKKL